MVPEPHALQAALLSAPEGRPRVRRRLSSRMSMPQRMPEALQTAPPEQGSVCSPLGRLALPPCSRCPFTALHGTGKLAEGRCGCAKPGIEPALHHALQLKPGRGKVHVPQRPMERSIVLLGLPLRFVFGPLLGPPALRWTVQRPHGQSLQVGLLLSYPQFNLQNCMGLNAKVPAEGGSLHHRYGLSVART